MLNESVFPNVLVFKRRSMRQYPEGISVALYYSSQLDRYITVPFNTLGIADASANMTETTSSSNTTANRLKKIRSNMADTND